VDADAWDERYAATELVWSADANQFLVAEVEAMAPGRALDVACGEGRNALWLAERGWTVTGVDFSAVAIAKAARLAEGRQLEVEWVTADLLAWRPPEAAFDLVIVFYLQLAAPARGRVLRGAASAVADGGTLLYVAHDLENLTAGTGGPQDPAVLATADDVAAELVDAGLEIERAGQVRRAVGAVPGEDARTAIDTLVRAHR
jgi:SAM-dependent methyltransferase